MCGIFGVVVAPGANVRGAQVRQLIHKLLLLSENRGSEATGLSVNTGALITTFREADKASRVIKRAAFKDFQRDSLSDENVRKGVAAIGHSRLVTNGTQGIELNNQPINTQWCSGLHNGIVVNDDALWAANPDFPRETHLDSEIIYRLFDRSLMQGTPLTESTRRVFDEIEGEANIAFFNTREAVLTLATNVGSLYWANLADISLTIFASERYFVKHALKTALGLPDASTPAIAQLRANTAAVVPLDTAQPKIFAVTNDSAGHETARIAAATASISDRSAVSGQLTRCSRCILPHTFPFISFDADGVCNFCRTHINTKPEGASRFEQLVGKYRSKNSEPDCIVALSGGRDSCYGLHVIKTELGLNPIAYTYDWAMVTDEARRNASRICAELQVEHIIRSADILAKRRNIRSNISAWLQRPDLGMIPLFMAGDKQFFHYAATISRETGIHPVIFCGGNNLEVTRFKTGFCGIEDRSDNTMVGLSSWGKIQLLAYYAKNYILNPRYLNRSVFDTLFAYYSTYLNRRDFIYLYKYIPWDEARITDTLVKNYGWENPSDAASTWRIGDGTAAFYNYIYHTVAGFSEHDTFRSNQIREGLLSREQALSFVIEENKPRHAAMQEYANLVGFSLDEALTIINRIPKLTGSLR